MGRAAGLIYAEDTMKEILVPVDFTPASAAALDYAARLADSVGARLHILHVVEPSSLASLIFVAPMGFPTAVIGPVEAARTALALLRPDVRATRHVGYGWLLPVVLAYADRHGIDAIVLGLRRRAAWRPGHAYNVIRHARCPVVAIHPDGIRSEVSQDVPEAHMETR